MERMDKVNDNVHNVDPEEIEASMNGLIVNTLTEN